MGAQDLGIHIEKIVVGYLQTNCYIVVDNRRDAVIIDPGGSPEQILAAIDRNSWRPQLILLTHGHSDHISGVEGVQSGWPVPILAHRLEVEFIGIPARRQKRYFTGASDTDYYILEDGDEIDMRGWSLEVIFTPGHTPGGVSYRLGGDVFTGDTLFMDGVGRTDFRGGDADALFKSISTRLLPLGDHVRIHPGHGPASTIGKEKDYF